LYLLTKFTSIDKSISFTCSFFLSVAVRFFIDKNVTFRYICRNRYFILGKLFFIYTACCVFTYFVGLVIFRCGILIGFSVIISKLISIPPVTMSGYLLFKYFVFKNRYENNV
jgi:putative flippase GtrA